MGRVRRKLRIVFATSEATPFCKTGGLGDVSGSLPQELARCGCKVIVMLPKYGIIAQEWVDRMEHVCDFYLPLGWRNEYCGLERLERDGVQYYFIDNERYFKRESLYGYFDDGERFAFFSKAITESLKYLPDFECDVLHCNDWQTALAPVFLREFYQNLPMYGNVKTMFTVHNVKFQGQYGDSVLSDICGLADIPAASWQLYIGPRTVNYMKGALLYSDILTTVSPTYMEELKTPFYGEGLDWIFRDRWSITHGILNGIDNAAWDPEHDSEIPAHFSARDLEGKALCKAELQAELGLDVDPERPLVCMVTRLTKQKGLDLVQYAMERLLSRSVQVAILGNGDSNYEDSLRYFDWKYQGAMCARIEFNAALSKRMYAGADLFLMPSLFEPCGLSQMISMRYGTLPVVRETGGLRDSVMPYNQFTGEGTGFSFANFNGDEMADCVLNACEVFWTDKDMWHQLMMNAMAQDFSWKRAAQHYMDLYASLHPEVVPYTPPRRKG